MKETIVALICLLAVVPCEARIISVDDDGPADFNNIQAAINDANDGDTVEIRRGTYTGDGNCDISFMGKGMTVRSTDPNDPAVVAATIIDCNGSWSDSHRGFVFDSNEEPNSVLSGMTITRGSFLYLEGKGGAIYCHGSSPTISKCKLIHNEAAYGGAIACIDSNAVISDCLIQGNYTEGCGSNGGGVYLTSGDTLITQCVITGNISSDRQGGGILCNGSNSMITECLIVGNRCGEEGGGIGCIFDSVVAIEGCTIADNRAAGGGGVRVYSSCATVRDSILWGNRAADGNQIGLRGTFGAKGEITLTYSDVEELQQGIYVDWEGQLNLEAGNIDADPIFVERGHWDDNGTPDYFRDDFWVGGDYHLKSEGWYWNSDANQWDWDEVTSRCIDVGNPGASLGDEALTLEVDPLNRFGHNLRVNMGAYGGTAEASMPPYDWALLADLNNDGTVNFIDVGHYTEFWLEAASELPADLDRDGMVDLADHALLGQDYFLQTSWHQ